MYLANRVFVCLRWITYCNLSCSHKVLLVFVWVTYCSICNSARMALAASDSDLPRWRHRIYRRILIPTPDVHRYTQNINATMSCTVTTYYLNEIVYLELKLNKNSRKLMFFSATLMKSGMIQLYTFYVIILWFIYCHLHRLSSIIYLKTIILISYANECKSV